MQGLPERNRLGGSFLMADSDTRYVRGKRCPNCGNGWIVDQGDFLECEDCGCEVDARCKHCGRELERDGSDHIKCDCSGP